MTQKQETAFSYFQNAIKNVKFSKAYKDWVVYLVAKNIDSIKIIKNRFVFKRDFYSLLVEYIKENHKQLYSRKKEVKLDNEFYKFFNTLKRKEYIHRSSTFYPKSLILTSINPNPFNMLHTNFEDLDSYAIAKKKFEYDLDREPSLQGLYIYLRLFNSYIFTKQMLQTLHFHDVLYLSEEKSAFVLYYKLLMKSFSNNKIYTVVPLDSYVTKILRKLKYELDLTSNYSSMFVEINKFEDGLYLYKKKNLPTVSMNSIRAINKTYHNLKTCSAVSTLISRTVATVPLSLADVNALFPNSINSSSMSYEKSLIQKCFEYRKDDSEWFEFEKDPFCYFDIYETIEFEYIVKSKTEPEVKDITAALDKLKKMREITSSETKKLIYSYLIDLLHRLLTRKIRHRTFKNYVYTLNKHIFKMIENLEDIKPYEVHAIINRIERDHYSKKTVDTFNVIFKNFFAFINKQGFVIDLPALLYPKSIIFENEVDKILELIEDNHEDINEYRQTKRSKLLLLQKKAIVLLAFYSGLRKNELRTRLLRDIYYDGDRIYIDVNEKGLKKEKLKLKNKNAKRRVELTTCTQEHLEILKQWYELRKKLFDDPDTFLFLKNQGKKIYRKKVIEEDIFEEFNKIIKYVTRRYATFHSFRHSFATYRLKEILNKKGNDKAYELLEFSIQMGHQTPQITFNSYIHYGIIELLMEH